MKILIKVTKEILERSAMCPIPTHGNQTITAVNCALALALRDVFPNAYVGIFRISLLGLLKTHEYQITTSLRMREFMSAFDQAGSAERCSMSPISFEIDVPSEVIDKIGIGQVYKILSESKTLELVAI